MNLGKLGLGAGKVLSKSDLVQSRQTSKVAVVVPVVVQDQVEETLRISGGIGKGRSLGIRRN